MKKLFVIFVLVMILALVSVNVGFAVTDGESM